MKLIIKRAGLNNLTLGKAYEVLHMSVAGKVGKVVALIEDDHGNIVYIEDLILERIPFCVRDE